LTCFLAGGKFDQYKKINKFSLIQEKCPWINIKYSFKDTNIHAKKQLITKTRWLQHDITIVVKLSCILCIHTTRNKETIMLYRVHFAWARFELTTWVVIGSDCNPTTIRSRPRQFIHVYDRVWQRYTFNSECSSSA
jgi:hypothetical protein